MVHQINTKQATEVKVKFRGERPDDIYVLISIEATVHMDKNANLSIIAIFATNMDMDLWFAERQIGKT